MRGAAGRGHGRVQMILLVPLETKGEEWRIIVLVLLAPVVVYCRVEHYYVEAWTFYL